MIKLAKMECHLGIYGPGYAERRKQRIKERYGIDVQEPYYTNKSAEAGTEF